MTRIAAERRAMTAGEITMGTALGFARVLPGTPDKQFVAVMAACARDPEPEVTERQALYLRVCVHKYRRQLRPDVVALAGEIAKQTLAVAATACLEVTSRQVIPNRPSAPSATPQLSLL